MAILLPLTINGQSPTFQWAKTFGGLLNDEGNSITVDPLGNVYTTGYFISTVDFDPGPGIFNLTSTGARDVFISKLDAGGNFIWAIQLGGSIDDYGLYIQTDAIGNVYLTGTYQSTTDFDPGAASFNLTSIGASDIFILKLTSSGTFAWAKSIGGSSTESIFSFVLDQSNNIYATGNFYSTTDFDPNGTTFNLTATGVFSMFLLKLDSNGDFVWAKSVGGTGGSTYVCGRSIAQDTLGNLYYSGYFAGVVDFDPGGGSSNKTSNGFEDIFLLKTDSLGVFNWIDQFGGTGGDKGVSVMTKNSTQINLSGYFVGNVDFDPGAGISNLTSAGCTDICLVQVDASGNLIWAKQMSGAGCDQAIASTMDPNGNIYTTGYFNSTIDFDPGVGTANLSSDSLVTNDVFICKIDANGNYLWAKGVGGKFDDAGTSIVVDGTSEVYTVGYFQSTCDFDPDASIFNISSIGNKDIFVHKMSQAISGVETFLTAFFQIDIYPNPASDYLIVNGSEHKSKLSVLDVTGKIILEDETSNGKYKLDIQSLASGFYLIKIEIASSIVTGKFIKN